LRFATVHRYQVLFGLSPPVIKHAWHTKKNGSETYDSLPFY
jgi:hypothetical protein